MSTDDQLERLGLTVRRSGQSVEAELDLVSLPLLNPITRRFINKVTFAVTGERLLVTSPLELVGTLPISVAAATRQTELEQQLTQLFNEQISQLQRRTQELQTLGIKCQVNPDTIALTAEVTSGEYAFRLSADRRGTLSVTKATRGGAELPLTGGESFELSEFREKSALEGYLVALVAKDGAKSDASPATIPDDALTFGELSSRFGAQALLPPKSALEVLVAVRVRGAEYRFAAARMSGKSFRGLLAGPAGKLWAERFELSNFPGVTGLVARILRVSPDEIEVLG